MAARFTVQKSTELREDAAAMRERSRRELEKCLQRTQRAFRSFGNLPHDPHIGLL